MWQVWMLPALIVVTLVVLAIPLGYYLAWVLDGRYRAPAWLAWLEGRFHTGEQNWKQYAIAMLMFNVAAFAIGFALLAAQHWLPLNQQRSNPDGKPRLVNGQPIDTTLAPTTVFNTASSFLTNTNLQHYAGEVHLTYFSQLFVIGWKQFITPAIGLAALLALIRGLRGDSHMGNFYVDLWRCTMYVLMPLALVLGVLLIACGTPMTFARNAEVTTIENVVQVIARGPVAAIVAIKQLGTNGGGFFGTNSCHPFENPNEWSNFLGCVAILLLPMALMVMFGRMLNNMRHAAVVFGVMLVLLLALMGWGIYWDTLEPNPGLTGQPALAAAGGRPYAVRVYREDGTLTDMPLDVPMVAALPVNQRLGNLEGKELRFGTSAGPTWAACTTCTSNGSVNCMHDSLNPLAGLTPLAGMWLNCSFGGVGVGLINMLVYLITGVFLAGLMVGRTPEYLGKKIEAREMKLAMLALLAHPLLILGGTGLFAALDWGQQATNNPGAHGFSEILYEFTSASAKNGSGFEGLGDTWGYNQKDANASPPAPYSPHWDIATALVMLLSRFIPILAPLALAGGLAAKKPTPFTVGTLRTDTITFGLVLLGTIILVGALLFLPAAVLGPVAEHLGPMPFGR